MKILHIADSVMAYVPARFVDLTNKYTEHEARLIQLKSFHIGNPLKVPLLMGTDLITDALHWADFLHFHGCHSFNRRKIVIGHQVVAIDKFMKKPFVLEHHGSPVRENFKNFQKAVPVIVSTPEMLPLFPNSTFFPNLIDETDVNFYKPRIIREDKAIKICHHFSFHRRVKNTNNFLLARQHLINSIYELQLLEKASIDKTIAKRAEFDCVFDHLQGYYGLISIEGLAQGLLTINNCGFRNFYGFDTDSMLELKKFFGKRPPFFIAGDDLYQSILRINRETIERHSEAGKKFMSENWSGKKNIHRLIELYQKLN